MEQSIQPNQVTDYFRKGLSLTNKSWGIFLFGLILTSLSGLPEFLGDSFVKSILQTLGFLLLFIEFGFFYSLPIFLLAKQEGKSVDFGDILSTSLHNTKRLILPFILTLILLIILFIVGFILVVQFIYGGNFSFMENATQGFNPWNIFFAFFIGLFAFLTFSPIYFSLEKNGLLKSIKRSINLSVKHLDFIAVIFAISAVIFLISTLLLKDYQSLWQILLRGFIYQYETLLFAAAALIFYQHHGGLGISSSSLSSAKIEEVGEQVNSEQYRKFLAPNEKVIKVFDYANSQFIWDLIIGILLIPLLLFGLIWMLIAIYRKLTIRYLVTDKRVIVKKGLIGQSTVSADYSKITDVTVQQGILGRLLLHTGTIVVNTAGTDLGEITIKWVENPFKAKDVIYGQLHKK
jgi:membrane protein YdbS with pleckstrin-like domain